MAYQEIGLGTTAADGTGDSIRVGGDKINDNFVELYTLLGTGTELSSGISASATVVTLAAPTISGVVGGTQTSATITTLATTTVNATTLNGAIGTAAQTNITSLGTLTALQVDNLNINGNAITSTAGTDLTIAPVSGQQIVLDDTIIIDAGVVTGATSITSTSFVGALTGNASGTAATVTGAAQTNITSLGTLTALAVDDISLNGKVLIMTGDTDDTVTFTTAANGTLSIVTVDDAAAAANIQITADGTVDIDSAGVLTLDSGAAINIEPAGGSAILLDGTISVDAGVVTGATSITSTAFVGALSGTLGAFLDVAGNYIQTEKGGDLSSASPLVIDTDGDYFDVTGTTNFAAMTVAADRQFTLQFDGALTMTHHATNLDLPGEANITTAAGDVGVFQSTGANTVQCISFTKADGTAVAAGAGGGPSKGTAPSTFYRTNGKVQKEDIVISNHSATFSAVHGAETLSRGTDDGFADDMNVRLTGSDLPNGFVIDTDYFVRDVASATMKLALTIAGTAVTISDNGSGTNTVFEVINAGVTGPITIKAGNSLTIPSGSRVVIQ